MLNSTERKLLIQQANEVTAVMTDLKAEKLKERDAKRKEKELAATAQKKRKRRELKNIVRKQGN